MEHMNAADLRTVVRGAYDIQKLRIQCGNRWVANFKAKLGQAPSEREDTLDPKDKKILDTLRANYKKITDGVKVFPRAATFKGNEIISKYTELCVGAQYIGLEKSEQQHFARLNHILKDFPIWTEFMLGVKGVGPAMGGVIISEIDITKARYVSSLWKYAGLDVAEDGRGRSRKKEHLVERDYINKKGEPDKRMGITFNPFLKTKLTGVLGASFLRAPDNKYKSMYHAYKNRLVNHEIYKDVSLGHRHNMAIRYIVKQFLVDLYANWRTLENLPVAAPYAVEKLGRVNHASV